MVRVSVEVWGASWDVATTYLASLSGCLPAQSFPPNPAGHWHEKELTPSLQNPLFLHGPLAQSLMSEKINDHLKRMVLLLGPGLS